MDSLVRVLKFFVFGAAIVLVLGTAALVWLLVTRDDQQAAESAARIEQPVEAASPAAPPPEPAAPVVADLPLPPGAMVVDMRSEGGRVVLLVRAAGGEEYIAVIDAATGERRLLLRLVAEEPAALPAPATTP